MSIFNNFTAYVKFLNKKSNKWIEIGKCLIPKPTIEFLVIGNSYRFSLISNFNIFMRKDKDILSIRLEVGKIKIKGIIENLEYKGRSLDRSLYIDFLFTIIEKND